ncbi:MAG TPA: RMD1 family protein [bacterium]
MTLARFAGRRSLGARALVLGHHVNLRSVDPATRLAAAPLVVTAGAGGCAVLFRYGAAVLVGLEPAEAETFLAALRPLVREPYPSPESEELELALEPAGEERLADGRLALQAFDVARIQVVADALAKSAVLEHYEKAVAAVFDELEPLAEALSRGRPRVRGRALVRHVGRTLDIQQRMVGRVEVEEKPEALWERPDLERLYQRLAEEYELPERHRALERKLELIARTAQTLLTLQYNRRSLRVEWYIVALIVLEILLTLRERFF